MDKERCSAACPYKDQNYPLSEGFGDFNKSILFIANRGDNRILQPALFGNEHEQAMLEADSGKSLLEILAYCNLDIKDIRLTNILKCVLPQETGIPEGAYLCCESNLSREIEHLNPKSIVAFGKPCLRYMFPNVYDGDFLKQVGKIYDYHNRPVLIEHHLSKIYRLQKPNEAERIKQFLDRQKSV